MIIVPYIIFKLIVFQCNVLLTIQICFQYLSVSYLCSCGFYTFSFFFPLKSAVAKPHHCSDF